jgi:hypothetical protein
MDDPTPRGARRPRYPWIRNNILGLVAIFIALGGTAFAAQVAGNHGKAQVAKKVKKGPRGPAGPQGIPGTQGIQGVPGANGATNVTTRTAPLSVPSTNIASATANCNTGEHATGGGVTRDSGNATNTFVVDDMPDTITAGSHPTGWTVSIFNSNASSAQTYTVFAVCAAP